MEKERLIGFDVITSVETTNSITQISKIRPIFDSPNCGLMSIDLSSILDSYDIDLGADTKSYTLSAPDDISFHYGSMDGHTFCGERTYELEGNPDWVSVQGD